MSLTGTFNIFNSYFYVGFLELQTLSLVKNHSERDKLKNTVFSSNKQLSYYKHKNQICLKTWYSLEVIITIDRLFYWGTIVQGPLTFCNWHNFKNLFYQKTIKTQK